MYRFYRKTFELKKKVLIAKNARVNKKIYMFQNVSFIKLYALKKMNALQNTQAFQ